MGRGRGKGVNYPFLYYSSAHSGRAFIRGSLRSYFSDLYPQKQTTEMLYVLYNARYTFSSLHLLILFRTTKVYSQ